MSPLLTMWYTWVDFDFMLHFVLLQKFLSSCANIVGKKLVVF